MDSRFHFSPKNAAAPGAVVIERILALAGPMPDAEAYRRYLEALSLEELNRKAFDLAEDQKKARTEPVRFWRTSSPAFRFS